MIHVRRMGAPDIPLIAAQARTADRLEIEEGCGQSLEGALAYGLAHSVEPLVIAWHEQPLAAFGEVAYNPGAGIGVPWLISTQAIEAHARPFLRACRPLLARMQQRHILLTNYVDARNTAAIRWLEWLGFSMSSPMPYGPQRLPFRQFQMTRER